ncbi:MAG: phytanoyl-CoA dioxygenase family protein [Planctomycetota bacterium]|nr:phytanoyl-CoA dioxygenase family protein [Planctomycetota bacterium]
MPDIKLTAQQLAFFETFGYLSLPGLLADSIDSITAAFEEIWARQGGGHHGKPHDGKARSCVVPFLDQHERLCALLDDPRIHGLLTSLVGDDFNYMGSDGNYYVGDTGWHSDGWHPRHRHVKIALYLDPLTRDTGCLRVIPGSHVEGDKYATALQKNMGQLGLPGNQIPCMPLETKPGDIAVFNHNTKHAAFGGSQRRRMFTINCCERYPEQDLQVLRDYISGFARFWVDTPYSETMLRTAGPARMRHLEQVLANDDHLPALTKAAREKMAEPSRG